MRYSCRTLLISVSVSAILAAIAGGVVRSIDRTYDAARDFYAIDQTRMMLTDFVYANEGNWPTSWKDLRSHYDKYEHLGWSRDFEMHKELVCIDFTFSPSVYFKQNPQPHLARPKLVSLNSLRNDWDELDKVNRRLLATLRSMYVTD